MCCIHPRVCPNFHLYSISALRKSFPVNGSAAMSSFFSYLDSDQKVVSNFLKLSVENHLVAISMMLSVRSTLKPRGDQKIWRFRYLRKDYSRNLFSKDSSKTLLSSGNTVSLLVLFRKSPLATII